MAYGPQRGLTLLISSGLSKTLENYYLYHATRADLHRRLGQWADAANAYRLAVELTQNAVERAFLARRLAEVTDEHCASIS